LRRTEEGEGEKESGEDRRKSEEGFG